MRKHVRIVVRGRVQGVSFRAYTRNVARSLELQGFVKNLPGGDVEIVAEGDSGRLDWLIAWAREGPPMAAVDDLDVSFSEPTNIFHDFTIKY